MENLGEEYSIWAFELAIEVAAGEASAVVTEGDPVRVEHWDDFEDDVPAKDRSLMRLAAEPLDESFHHVRSVGLSRMCPS